MVHLLSWFYFLMHSNIPNKYSLSPIYSVSSINIMEIIFLSLFTLCNRQVYILHWFNSTLRIIGLIYSLNQWCASCTRPQIQWTSANTSLWIYPSSSAFTILIWIFMYISYNRVAYKNSVSTYMTWEYQLFINHISITTCRVMSESTCN